MSSELIDNLAAGGCAFQPPQLCIVGLVHFGCDEVRTLALVLQGCFAATEADDVPSCVRGCGEGWLSLCLHLYLADKNKKRAKHSLADAAERQSLHDGSC